MDTEFQLRRSNSATPVLTIQGIVDFTNVGRVRKSIREHIAQGNHQIRLDASGVTFMDSSGIAALVDLNKEAHRHGGRLILTAVSQQLARLLDVVGLAGYFGVKSMPVPAREVRREHSRLPLITWFTVPCHLELASMIRERVTQVATALPFTEQEIGDIKVAVGEAVANAFRHGCRGREDASIVVRCEADSRQLTVEITDPGEGFDCDALKPPVIEEVRDGGMGVHFMRLLMDSVEYRIGARGCMVRMVKRIGRERSMHIAQRITINSDGATSETPLGEIEPVPYRPVA